MANCRASARRGGGRQRRRLLAHGHIWKEEAMSLRRWSQLLVLPILLVVALASYGLMYATRQTAVSAAPVAVASSTPASTASTLPDIASVAAKVRPATVLIYNYGQSNSRGIPGQDGSAGDVPQGAGTGFIIDPSGYIVTNNHVVEGAQKLTVTLPPPDSRTFEATLVGRDPQTDLAVVKIDGQNLPTVPLGNSSELRVGEWVVAIGNALALKGGPTVTAGVVSAVGRDEQEPPNASGSAATLYDLIQTDAAINPGNSGGPLVNMQGEVVGVNTLGTTQAQGIGFAISIDGAKPIIAQLRQNGKVTRGYLGIGAISLTAPVAAQYGLSRDTGVLVAQVQPGSPAATAGLQQGDVIIGLGSVDVQGLQDLQQALTTQFKPGDQVAVKIDRNGTTQTVNVTLGTSPTQ
jgi:serine protease Do